MNTPRAGRPVNTGVLGVTDPTSSPEDPHVQPHPPSLPGRRCRRVAGAYRTQATSTAANHHDDIIDYTYDVDLGRAGLYFHDID